MTKQTVRIEQWKRVRLKGKTLLVGTFFDHHTIKDGSPGTTGPITYFSPDEQYAESDFTVYKLGERAK